MRYSAALAMWLVMSGAMMAPVVYPWLRALHRLAASGQPAHRAPPRSSAVLLGPFGAGYAVAWAGFSASVAAGHSILATSGLPVPLGVHAPKVAALVLLGAGSFQFTGLKESCLVHCRSPAGYLLAHWRDGPVGWLVLGLRHGLYCVGCCWALMALAFVVGMTSIAWMGLMAAFMVAETALPFGRRLTKPVGAALLVLGTVMLVR